MTEPTKAQQLAATSHIGYRVGWQREAAAELLRLDAENAAQRDEIARLRHTLLILRNHSSMTSHQIELIDDGLNAAMKGIK